MQGVRKYAISLANSSTAPEFPQPELLRVDKSVVFVDKAVRDFNRFEKVICTPQVLLSGYRDRVTTLVRRKTRAMRESLAMRGSRAS